MRLPAIFLAGALLTAGTPGTATVLQGQVDSTSVAVDRLVERYRTGRKIPGIAIAVVRNGHVIKAQGYGSADLELGTPVTPACGSTPSLSARNQFLVVH